MPFEDKTLACADCGNNFVFTAGEQEFYAQKGFTNIPKRCGDCRSNRKVQHGNRGGGGGGSAARGDRPRGGAGGGGGRGFGAGRGPGGPRPPRSGGVKFPATCSRCGAAFDAPFEPKQGRPIFCRDCFDASKGR